MLNWHLRIMALAGLLATVCVHRAFADDDCRAAHEILGLSLHPVAARGEDAPAGLEVTEILPLSQGARVGLQEGDLVEQVNSWPTTDCESYRRAVLDAQERQKAVLMLVSRDGQREPIFLEPEIWQRAEEERQQKEAIASIETMLAAPLPPDIKEQTLRVGDQALAILHRLQTAAVPRSPLARYEHRVADAESDLSQLDRSSQTEAEKRVVSGAAVLLGYYVAAAQIMEYKHEYIREKRGDLQKGRAHGYVSEGLPYFLDSPVAEWVGKYSFLREAIKERPQKTGWDFVERPGLWDPDLAVQLLWNRAKQETATYAQWIEGKQITSSD